MQQQVHRPAPNSAERAYSPFPWYTDDDPAGMRERIIDGARRGLLHFGSEKLSMNDIARLSSCSRATLYKHFNDRDTLVKAVNDQLSLMYVDDVTNAMSSRDTLDDQLVEVVRVTHDWVFTQTQRTADARGLMSANDSLRLAVNADNAAYSMVIDAIRPFLAKARDRREIRPEIPVDTAAEWIARSLATIATIRSRTFDDKDPVQVDQFFRTFLLRGLT